MSDANHPDHPDRYVSFTGIDCVGVAHALVERIRLHIDDPAKTNALWEKFKQQLAKWSAGEPGAADELRLVCSYVAYIEELFTAYDDADGLALLGRVEEDCC
ncbi:MAG: N(2)-fixation sustaining protein CowN [Defluviicoccus sp.]|nr:MAG: N(2)-fixation sustaining protein CowN [Defluviicoccus sp.]